MITGTLKLDGITFAFPPTLPSTTSTATSSTTTIAMEPADTTQASATSTSSDNSDGFTLTLANLRVVGKDIQMVNIADLQMLAAPKLTKVGQSILIQSCPKIAAFTAPQLAKLDAGSLSVQGEVVWRTTAGTSAVSIDVTPSAIASGFVVQFLEPGAHAFTNDLTITGTGVTASRLNEVIAKVGSIDGSLKFAASFRFAAALNPATEVGDLQFGSVATIGGSIFDGSVEVWKRDEGSNTITIDLSPTATRIGHRAMEHLLALQYQHHREDSQVESNVLDGNLVVMGADVSGAALSLLLTDLTAVSKDLTFGGHASPALSFAAGDASFAMESLALVGRTLTVKGVGNLDGFSAKNLTSVNGTVRIQDVAPFTKGAQLPSLAEQSVAGVIDVDFCVSGPVGVVLRDRVIRSSSTVLTSDADDAKKFCDTVLNSFTKPRLGSTKLTLLYRMSRDDGAATTFHNKVDDKGKTIVIAQSANNYVFGAGTDVSWTTTNGYRSTRNAFLFCVRCRSYPDPEMFPVSTSSSYYYYAMYDHSRYGPTFGRGYQTLRIASNPTTTNCYSDLNYYNTYTGGSDAALTGSYDFKLKDYEVYKVG